MKINNYKKSMLLKPLILAMALPGSAMAADCTGIAPWDSGAVYNGGDQVQHQNNLYEAKWWTTNEDPSTTGQWGVWKDEGLCSNVVVNQPPTVSFTEPANNAEISLGQSVDFVVDAQDSDGTIASVEFKVNGAAVTSPWIADKTGNVQVSVLVTDDDGATADAAINLNVVDVNNLPPVVGIDSPASGTTAVQGEVVKVTVSASDPDVGDSISKVELLLEGAVVDTDVSAPYEFNWTAATAGPNVLTARAFDSKNDNAVSSAVTVNVTPGNQSPTASVTSPAAQAQFAEGATVAITADAADSDGTVASVEFFVDNTLISTDTAAPFEASWVAAGNGAHTIKVVVSDDKGAQTTSSSVSINVGDQPTDHEACRPDGLVGDSVYCDIYDTDGREKMGADHQRRVIGYFTSWRTGLNGKPGYIAKDIPWDKITHINYAFAHVSGDNKVSIGNPNDPANAATGIEWPGVAGAEMDPEFNFKGHFNQLAKYKKQYPDVKTLISVGGWAETGGYFDADGNRVASGGFYKMAESQASIDTFADSAVEFIRKYQFDGVDIDYEYATSNNGAGNPQDEWISGPNRATLWAGYENLMKTLREKLDAASKADGKHYMLTIASPASGWLLRGQEFYQVTKYLDYVNIMSYDLHGAWNNHVGPNSALYDNGKDPELQVVYDAAQYEGIGYLNTDWAFHYFRGSMPAGRINIGLPYDSRGWKDVSGGNGQGHWGTSALADQSLCSPGTGTDPNVNPHANQNTAPCGSGATGIDNVWHDSKANGEEEPAGFNPMWHIMNLKNGIAGSYREAYGLTPATDPDDTLQGSYVHGYDADVVAPYLWNATRKSYLSIEDETSMAAKVQYVVDKGVGGVMFWELAGDYAWNEQRKEYFFGDTLTNIAYQGFKASTPYGNKKAEIEMPVRNLDIQVTYSGFKLGDNNYPIAPKMNFRNNSDIDIPGGSVIEFDVAVSTPASIADQSGLNMKVITDGSNTAGNNHGGFENTFHRVQFTVPAWQTIAKGEVLEGDIKVQLPVSSPSNFTIDINGVKYGFSEEHGSGVSFCDANPSDPACIDTPPPTDLCKDKGIDPTGIPAYPDFPQKDWQGNPSHANQGDSMQHNGKVYTAKWWTATTPGGSDWEFTCDI